MNNLKDIHNVRAERGFFDLLFYQDFNEQFEGYTQQNGLTPVVPRSCFIRISMNNLKDIHNITLCDFKWSIVVLSGFQWTIWRIYTTYSCQLRKAWMLFYQDFNEQFEGYTQLKPSSWRNDASCFIRISMNNLKDIHNCGDLLSVIHTVVLSGFQWTIWRIYTTSRFPIMPDIELFYQDFNEQFEGYTQLM